MMLLWRTILGIVYPKEERDSDVSTGDNYDKAFDLWLHYEDVVWVLLNDTSIEKNQKAAQVEKAARYSLCVLL